MGRAAVAPRPERKAAPAMPMATAPSSGGLARTLSAWWSWLARPPVAAGFAGLMVATVVGVMWWDRPLEEALPPREEAVVAAAPATPPNAATTATADAAAAKPAGLPDAAKRAAPPVPAETDLAKNRSASTAPATALTMKKAEAAPPVVAAAPAPTAPAVAAAPAPAPAPAIAADGAAREREALAERRDMASARMAAAAPPAAAAAASAYIETPSLSNLRFEIRRQPDAWTWQRDEGEARAMDRSMEDWIAQADRAARTVWLAGAGGPDTTTTTLRFTRGGVVRAVLRLGPNGMRLTRGGKTEQAELSRGTASTLQGSLDALGP
ncbi:MAG: hypothetical protein QM722_06605 [Piscinibacter sp.]